MDKRIWGPAFWSLLHGWAERIGDAQATEWSRFIRWLSDVIPCPVCQEHTRLQRRPDFGRMRGADLKEAARSFLYNFHKEVQLRLAPGTRPFNEADLTHTYASRDLTADAQTVLEAIRYGISINVVQVEAARAWRTHFERLKLDLGLALPDAHSEEIVF
jgi:hypothetical protein